MFNFKNLINLRALLTINQKKNFLLLLVLMVFAMFMEILILKFIFILLNSFSENSINENSSIFELIDNLKIELDINLLIIIIIFFVLFLKTILNLFINWKKGKFIFKTKEELSKNFLSGYLYMPRLFHMRVNTSELIKNITTEIDSLISSLLSLSNMFLEIILLTGLSIFLLFLNFKVTLACLLLFILFSFLLSKFNSKKTINLGKQRVSVIQKRLKNIIEALTGSKTFEITGARDKVMADFNLNNSKLAEISVETFFRNTAPKPLFEVFTAMVITIVLLIVIGQNIAINFIIPTLGVFLTASYRLIPSFSNFMSSLQGFQYSIQSLDNLSKDNQKFKKNKFISSNEKFNFKNIMELKNISFDYQNSENMKKNLILNNLNLKISKGSKIGITGESGSGKSTLIDIIMGLLPIQKGEIKIDEKNINQNIDGWQKNISCVPQEVFILDDTLKKNVAFGVDEKDINNNKVLQVLDQAGLGSFVKNLEKNIDTTIGERGERISGGQKQRIGIARALYFNPELLIFDEATSSLDKKTEERIINEIFEKNRDKTILFISHNLKVLNYCDKIYEIKNKTLNQIS